MTVEGYFDGTAVRVLEPVDLKVNQRVYINIPEEEESTLDRQLKVLRKINGLLDKGEAEKFDEVISRRVNLRERIAL